MEPYLPEPAAPEGLYGKEDFQYAAATNTYRCPAGAVLNFHHQAEDKGTLRFHYRNPEACARCALRARCTKAEYRSVSRWEHEDCVERMKQQVAAGPEKLPQRKTLIEHCWGTIKYLLPGGFLVKGLKKVGAELSLVHFAYNLKRVLAVLGLQKLMQAVKNKLPPPQMA